jgi:hypothetical protein
LARTALHYCQSNNETLIYGRGFQKLKAQKEEAYGMPQPVIYEIRRRSRQGATQPFLCCADDGQQYWVKGAKAGNEALCAEWIAGRLGQIMRLPIPEMAQVIVPEEIIAASAMEGILDLGAGVRFGSSHVEGAQEFDGCYVEQTEEPLRQRLLVFDVWIRNTDRTFSRAYSANGNPNLLWCTAGNQLRVIDHNNAFLPDDLFDPTQYARHVFTGERQRLTAEFKADATTCMTNALEQLDTVMAEIPDKWKTIDVELDELHRLTVTEIRRILEQPLREQGSFWNRVEGVL